MKKPMQSIIMPYHRNKQMLLYTTELLNKIIPKDVEIIVVGNNKNIDELILAIDDYINYYNYDRIKVKLKGLSPVNYRLQSSN